MTARYDRVPQAARDVFDGSTVEPPERELMLEMFRAYFNEPFIDDETRDQFWNAIIGERFDEAIPLMLSAHVVFLLEMLRPKTREQLLHELEKNHPGTHYSDETFGVSKRH